MELIRNLPVNLSIKNVSEEMADRLRDRARLNHRSLQGELLAILEQVLGTPHADIQSLHRRVRALGLRTDDEATRIVREERDAR